MDTKTITHYRDYLHRYFETTKRKRPSFSMSAWAKALGLKSTSSLTKILNGEREAGKDLVEKLVRYFKFNALEESQFRNLVTLSKLKAHSEQKTELANLLLQSQALRDLNVRLLEFDQFQLLSSYLPLSARELCRIPKMKLKRLAELLPKFTETQVQEALHLLVKMNLVGRDNEGSFVANDEHICTEHEIPSEAIKDYHLSSLDFAKESLKDVAPIDREFQSLVMLLHSSQVPELKTKIRKFLDTLELDLQTNEVNQLYQIQIQAIPVSKKFNEVTLKNQETKR